MIGVVDFLYESLPLMGFVAAWVVTACLLMLGLVGTLVPFLPGHLILFFCGGGALVDAEAGLRCGVVDLSGTRVFADFISGV